MKPTICKAIREGRILELRYHAFTRIVEPHVYGLDRHGDEVLRCYQLMGGSESDERAGWKLLKIKEANLVHLAETSFIARGDYRRDDPVVKTVFCQL